VIKNQGVCEEIFNGGPRMSYLLKLLSNTLFLVCELDFTHNRNKAQLFRGQAASAIVEIGGIAD
jgi:hypothetical protein